MGGNFGLSGLSIITTPFYTVVDQRVVVPYYGVIA